MDYGAWRRLDPEQVSYIGNKFEHNSTDRVACYPALENDVDKTTLVAALRTQVK